YEVKQKIFLSILLMFSIFNFACFNAGGTNENSINNPEQTGILAVHLSTAAGKTLLPDLDMDPASFTLTGSGPSGESFSVNSNQEMATITGLAIGEWTIQVDALNGESQGVGSGSGTVTVLGDQAVFLPIIVTPYDGFGSLDITVRWNAGDTANPSIEAQLLPQSGAPLTPGFNITGGNTGAYTNSSLATGYYTLTLSFSDTGVPVMGAVEIVRIVKDQVTSGTFEFYEINKAIGDIQVDIETEMDDPITVSINGTQDTQYQGHSMNLEASVPVDTGNVTYVWYLNGVSQSTGSTFTSGSDLAIGAYRIDVTAFTADGKRGGSAAHTFHVVEAPATKDITTFVFEAANNSGLPSDVSAVISGTSISAELPYGTDVSALVASFLTTGESVTVDSMQQESGVTANDFTSPVIYRVTAADSTEQDYSVTVTIALPSTPWPG
ncbi:MAG: hypothetical protein GY765_31395, partial [bacterium]|nr:hypothetical protein [bacterium]